MDELHSKADLLERIQAERRRLEKLLDEFGPGEWIQPGVVGEWSLADLLAHLADWETRFIAWLEVSQQGGSPAVPAPGLGWGDLDELNRQIYEQNLSRSLEEIQAGAQSSYSRFLSAVAATPERELLAHGLYPWTEGERLLDFAAAHSCAHYIWAREQVLKWRRRWKGI